MSAKKAAPKKARKEDSTKAPTTELDVSSSSDGQIANFIRQTLEAGQTVQFEKDGERIVARVARP